MYNKAGIFLTEKSCVCKMKKTGIFRTKYFIRLMRFKKGGLDMKILKSILNYIPLATFIIFVVTDGIISLTSALIFVISTIGLLINWKRKKPAMKN